MTTSIQSAVESENIPLLLEYLADFAQYNLVPYKGAMVSPKNSICFRGIKEFLETNNVYSKSLAKKLSDFGHKNIETIHKICPKFSKIYKIAIEEKLKNKKKNDNIIENNLLKYLEEKPLEKNGEKVSMKPAETQQEKFLKLAADLKAKSIKTPDGWEIQF